MHTRQLVTVAVVAVLSVLAVACKKPGKAGDACKKEWATDCTDKKNALVCVSGKLEAVGCRDNVGCMDMGDGNDNCSNNNQNVGEPCKQEGNYSCSVDSKAMLK